MVGKIKEFLLDKYPDLVINTLDLLNKQKIRGAQNTLEGSQASPQWLNYEQLENLQGSSKGWRQYGYDIEALLLRGKKRSRLINKLTGNAKAVKDVLELGARDGIVSYYLNRDYNKSCTLLDIEPIPPFFVQETGIEFVTADVSNIPLPDNSFDCIFSYNAMEHFPDPRRALVEAMRVSRSGAYIYLDFGPIYMAPKGYHAYNVIKVPYCHLLFTDEMLNEYCLQNGLSILKFAKGRGLNGWHLNQYRELWDEIRQNADVVLYREYPDYNHMGMIEKYPSCFKSKTNDIDNLYTARLEILIRKKL